MNSDPQTVYIYSEDGEWFFETDRHKDGPFVSEEDAIQAYKRFRNSCTNGSCEE